MPRYVDADMFEVVSLTDKSEEYTNGALHILDMVDKALTADVQEIKHGKWMGASDGDGIVCSVCGSDFCTLVLNVYNYNYCPNCGAKMDGEESGG